MKIMGKAGGGLRVNYYVRYLMYRNRYRLARAYRAAALILSFLTLLSVLYFFVSTGHFSKVLEENNFSLFSIATGWSERDPCGLMRTAAPVMAWGGKNEDFPEEITPMSLVTALVEPFRIDLGSPSEIIATGVPALAEYKRGQAALAVSGPAAIEDEEIRPAGAMIAEALVGIYHTHTGETYALSDGVERCPGGEKGGVVEVGRALKDELENGYGIRAAHYDRVNDANYSLAYVESEKTARRLLEENSDIQIVLDIHRDAGQTREKSVVKINGEEVATVLFIVGSDARLPFPSWKNNHSFALRLADRLNKEYPGLCVGVRVKEGRYNQFLHPRAALVEIGTVNSSTPEAVRSARLLARALAEELGETVPDKLKGIAGSP